MISQGFLLPCDLVVAVGMSRWRLLCCCCRPAFTWKRQRLEEEKRVENKLANLLELKEA